MSNSWSSTDDALEMDDLIEQGLKAYSKLTERRRLIYGCRSVEKLIDGTEPEVSKKLNLLV
jgi:ribosomal protein L7Ae-like RNA K-turn-binding protein